MELEIVKRNYNVLARHYDLINFIYTMGLDPLYRKKAIDKLNLKKGDRVLDIGCGTGLNFRFIERKIGEKGRIMGIDCSRAMLAEARKKIVKNNWDNVDLICMDAVRLSLNASVEFDAILSTYLVSIYDYRTVIARGVEHLRDGGMFVIEDIRLADGLLGLIMNPFTIIMGYPFNGLHLDKDKNVGRYMREFLDYVSMERYYFGTIYTIRGRRLKNSNLVKN